MKFTYYVPFSISGSGMDWELSSISRLLTVGYLLIGVPIMFVYLKTTGGLAAKAIRLLTKQLINCHRRQFVGKDGSRLSQTTCGKVYKTDGTKSHETEIKGVTRTISN